MAGVVATPSGSIDLTNRETLLRSLRQLPESQRQGAVDYVNATLPGHSASSWIKAGVGAVFGLATAGGLAGGDTLLGSGSGLLGGLMSGRCLVV